MAAFSYKDLKKKYGDFRHPTVVIEVAEKDITDNKAELGVTDIDIEMSCGFEASIATFWIKNCFNKETSQFEMDKVKKYILLGSSVVIYAGYSPSVREVFRGFIAKVNFSFQNEDIPGIEVTCMDLKGIMMANNYSRQVKANSYSAAVKKILTEEYAKLQSLGIINKINVTATPDETTASAGGAAGGAGQSAASDKTIEMVCESDYEFIVKAAKKFNYEFFAVGGDVYFRKAKDDTSVLMELSPATGVHSISVEYDVTGLVEKVEVRSIDAGKAKLVSANQKSSNKISQGSKAKQIVKGSQKVYLDPTVSSKEDAGYRASYLLEDMAYRFGTLEAELIGLPELTPGKFVSVTDMGDAISNLFYLTSVRHIFGREGYVTRITGKAAQLDGASAAGIGGSITGGLGGLI